jgi:hypothetical protein
MAPLRPLLPALHSGCRCRPPACGDGGPRWPEKSARRGLSPPLSLPPSQSSTTMTFPRCFSGGLAGRRPGSGLLWVRSGLLLIGSATARAGRSGSGRRSPSGGSGQLAPSAAAPVPLLGGQDQGGWGSAAGLASPRHGGSRTRPPGSL